jgi:hypothetical protein
VSAVCRQPKGQGAATTPPAKVDEGRTQRRNRDSSRGQLDSWAPGLLDRRCRKEWTVAESGAQDALVEQCEGNWGGESDRPRARKSRGSAERRRPQASAGRRATGLVGHRTRRAPHVSGAVQEVADLQLHGAVCQSCVCVPMQSRRGVQAPFWNACDAASWKYAQCRF